MQNDNKQPFDLPRQNGGEQFNPQMPQQPERLDMPNMAQTPQPNNFNNAPQDKPLIEIPQEYYDKLEEERKEKEKIAQEQQVKEEQKKELSALSGKIMTLIMLNAVVIFACLFITTQKLSFAIFAIPIFIVVMTIKNAITDGKESNYPLSVLIGGMVVAVLTFIVSTIKEDSMDLWTYFAVAGAVTAFLGMIVSNMITNLICRRDEIKALQTIGYFLFFALLIGGPIYLYNKYPSEFHRIVFRTIGEVKAETEEEFVYKTLKNRYNIDFKCSSDVKMHIDYGNKITRSRDCVTPDNKSVEVYSTAYNESKNQYIVFDNLTDIMFFKPYEEKVNGELVTATGAKQVVTLFYPEKECLFVGDCANIEDYRQNITREENPDNQYKTSSSLDLSKYMSNYDSVKFINEGKYKPVVRVTGKFYSKDEYLAVVSKTEDYLNATGLKNNFGYIIIVQSYDPLKNHEKTEYEVTGAATSDKTFKDAAVTYDATK